MNTGKLTYGGLGLRAKEVKLYNGRYKGILSDEACEKLERVITLDKQGGCFNDLKPMIKDLTDDEIKLVSDGYGSGDTSCFKTGELTDLQTLGVAFMYYAGSCILGDSVGLGKTAEAAGLYNLLRRKGLKEGKEIKFIFLTEKNLLKQAQIELVRFTGLPVKTVTGEKPVVDRFLAKGEPACNLAGTHSLFNQSHFWDWFCEQNYTLLVVDESSVLGNLNTDITKNALKVIAKTERVIFLNATPFESKLKVFYSQLSLLDGSLLPAKTNFEKEFCVYDYSGMYPRLTGKYKNSDKFKWLVGYRYFARMRKDKGAVKEDCEGRIVLVPSSDIQKQWLKKSQMMRLVYDCPSALDSTIDFNEKNVPKLAGLRGLLENECKDAKSILIYVYYKQAQEYLSVWLTENGYSVKVLSGDTRNAERYKTIEEFKRGGCRILITNVQKGLNFGDCDYVIFYGFDSNPGKMVQFEGRVTRSFDIKGKRVYLLCGAGKEKDRLNKVIKERAGAAAVFTRVDMSCIMDLLLEGVGDE